jgi:predicted RNase H-like HicB family nuclease
VVQAIQAPQTTDFTEEELAEARRYPMVIYWSDTNDAYLVSLPDFDGATRHGETLAEAADKGLELVAVLIDIDRQKGRDIPAPGSVRQFVVR